MTALNILDCTLRDGGYYNSWDFSPIEIADYLHAMSEAGVNTVELGFRFFSSSGFKGACAYTTDEFLNGLNIPGGLQVGVMINAADIASSSDVGARLKYLFPVGSAASPVDLVRIACHVHEFDKACLASAWLADQGYLVGVNIMQITERTEEELVHLAEQAAKWPIHVLYFADSMGGMLPSQVSRIISCFREKWPGPIGIHTHDNMGLALRNTLQGIADGLTWIDSTVTGMGRGPGNAATEELLIEVRSDSSERLNITPLMSLIRQFFQPMKIKFGWGKNPYYYLAGKYGIHPTYVQEMMNDARYSDEDILAVIEHLRQVGGGKFSRERLGLATQLYKGDGAGEWDPSGMIEGRDVLILGNGPGASHHRAAIESYVRKFQPLVFALNTQSALDESLIDVRLASHPVRLFADSSRHAALGQPLVTPASALPTQIRQNMGEKTLFDYGLAVKPGFFEAGRTGCTLPTALVVGYALAVATSGAASKIIFAGFDGYEAGDPRNDEMRALLNLYLSVETRPPIISITPTVFRMLENQSVYGMIR